ncbi:ETC complex I subunit [Bartonella sp. DGB1]|uniref:ETC complex I subunit n=1 Tax=Bartonella sp. DGB1 TaxID=3239807 RepID=UPI003524FE6A
MIARIYVPAKNAMQSGRRQKKHWILEYPAQFEKDVDPLMGYDVSCDMLSQIRLKFTSLESAVDYASRYGISYKVEVPHMSKRCNLSYSNNFAYNRSLPWTH